MRTYTLRGENLPTLSAKFGVPVCMIVRANGGFCENKFRPGRRIFIPPIDFCAPKAHEHRLEMPDTIYSLSAKYGVTMDQIMRENSLTHPAQLATLKTVKIPSGNYKLYTVKMGETLEQICEKFSIAPETLLKENGRLPGIYPGLQLVIR